MQREINNGHEAEEAQQKEKFESWIDQCSGKRGEMIFSSRPGKPTTLVRANW
jgi:hypothetical protein